MKVSATIRLILLAAALAPAGCIWGSGNNPGNPHNPGDPPNPDQQPELTRLTQQLEDPSRVAKTKRDAAALLLARSGPQADAILIKFLADKSNRAAQIAIAEAIALSETKGEQFVKPLLSLLTGSAPSVRAVAGKALATYRSDSVLDAFVRISGDRRADRPARLVVINAMGQMLDKKSIDALMALVSDPDETIRDASCDSLAKATSIRSFGRDPRRWRQWWAKNRNKRRSVWLADLAESLSQANRDLERTNAELRRRLGLAMNDLYNATPAPQRDALLNGMLRDSLAEVRLAGAQLTQQWVSGGAKPSEALVSAVRSKVNDPDPAVRRVAPVLLVNLGDQQAIELLAARLKDEQVAEVRQAVYQGLGLLRSTRVWDLLVAGIAEPQPSVAAAAAAALARVAEKNHMAEAGRTVAVEALLRRYDEARKAEGSALREALLGAMGPIKDRRLVPLLTGALTDPAATVRLSAVKGLHRMGEGKSAAAVVPLAADADRGVRLAAIDALGALGGTEHLDAVLARTQDSVESDPTVRQQAWAVTMILGAKADAARLSALADTLAGRPDAGEHLIEVLKLWAGKIPPEQIAQWAPVRLRLCDALMAADRPAEAGDELAAVSAALDKAGAANAPAVRLKWIQALLADDDTSAIDRIAEIKDDPQFAAALAALLQRLEALQDAKSWDAATRLASAALDRLGKRLDDRPEKQSLAAILESARTRQREADRRRVRELVGRLTGADENARANSARELTALNARALPGLVAELKASITAKTPSPQTDKAILDLIGRLAPNLTGYNAEAALADRIKVLDGWAEKLSP